MPKKTQAVKYQKYLEPNDEHAFDDMEVRADNKMAMENDGRTVVACPQCQGYGGWHLRLNAYGPGKHFNASCFQCAGWGWVDAGSKDATCVHRFKEMSHDECVAAKVQHFGSCWHVVKCEKCGDIRSYDSSG